MNGTVNLASSLPPLLVERFRSGGRIVHVTTASNELHDHEQIIDEVERPLQKGGATITRVDLASLDHAALRSACDGIDALVVGGGDPYRLLAAARHTGLGEVASGLVDRGGIYCGISAGAMVAAPSLVPLATFSPFAPPPPGTDLTGLGLVDVLVLPHDDRDGRRARHEDALRTFGRDHHMVALRDDEHLVIQQDSWQLYTRDDDLHLRPATAADAGSIADLFVEAGHAAWAEFLSADQIERIVPQPEAWTERIAATDPRDIVVAVDAAGVAGYIWVRTCEDLDLTTPLGEVANFYTHPRVWGGGVGRRLMAHGLDRLRSMDYDRAVVWTEERNERPLRIYASGGWVVDGTSRIREFHGFPITELRHQIQL